MSRTLFEIEEAMYNLLEYNVDSETGEILPSIEIPSQFFKDRTDTYKINRTSLIITKDQTHAKRGEDGILRNTFTVIIFMNLFNLIYKLR